MRRQERKNAVRLQKMTRHRLRIQQFALTIRSTLHTRIIANNQRKQADRRAGLFRAFLALDDTASWVQGLPDVDSRRAYSSCQVWNPCFVAI